MPFLSSTLRLAGVSLGLLFAATALASDESQLIESINVYRAQLQRCAGQVSSELPPLSADPRLVLSAASVGNLQQAMASAGYPMKNVQAISLTGPRDAPSAMKAIQESFCQIVLDPQFVDVGVSRQDREWRIVLARPLLCSARLGDWQAEGQKLLAELNVARSRPRQCGAPNLQRHHTAGLERHPGERRRNPGTQHGQQQLLRSQGPRRPHPG